MSNWQENVMLAPHTTIQLGGPARFLVSVNSFDELKTALREAKEKNVRVHILGGGSNTVFADEGFDGLVIKIDLRGVKFVDEGETVVIAAQAGEPWEPLVAEAVQRNLAGFECLSGIPGTVGGTPVQNVGAYGQDVAQTIEKVTALDRETLAIVSFSADECQFSYRMSRFKGADTDRFVIVAVTYRLQKNGAPCLAYESVKEAATKIEGGATLKDAREIILNLRRAKSMMIDPNDPHTKSCGSFFMNPQVESETLKHLQEWAASHECGPVPSYPSEAGGRLVPAAWLIEQVGFRKGLRSNGVGISDNHPLALVNYDGTREALLGLAGDIQRKVKEQFDISLTREPVIV